MKLDLGAVILGGLGWLDRLLDHGFEIFVVCMGICSTALAWKFAGPAAIWFVVKVLVAIWLVVLVAFFGGFLVWLVGRRWAGR